MLDYLRHVVKKVHWALRVPALSHRCAIGSSANLQANLMASNPDGGLQQIQYIAYHIKADKKGIVLARVAVQTCSASDLQWQGHVEDLWTSVQSQDRDLSTSPLNLACNRGIEMSS